MGMSIDKAIKKLKGQQADFNEQYIDYGGINDAFFTAYAVMRKYQKIVDIVSLNDEEFKQCGLKELKEILEVIADGNDD